MLADDVERFANATPIVKPLALSYGRRSSDEELVSSGTVPSEGGPNCGVERKIANPPTVPVLSTSAHPTAVFPDGPPVSISRVLFGSTSRISVEPMAAWETPRWVTFTGRLKALPSSA
jgi:hypothetical protein